MSVTSYFSVITCLVFLILSISCDVPNSTDPSILAPNVAASPNAPNTITENEKWEVIETDDFSFAIPQSMQKQDVKGIDTLVLQYESDKVKLEINYGFLASVTVTKDQFQTHDERSEIIGGRESVITRGILVNKYNLPNFRKFYRSVEFPGSDDAPKILVFQAFYVSDDETATVMKIFDAIEYKAKKS